MNLGHPHTFFSPLVSNKQDSEHTQPQQVTSGLSACFILYASMALTLAVIVTDYLNCRHHNTDPLASLPITSSDATCILVDNDKPNNIIINNSTIR